MSYRPFTLERGRLTARTEDAALLQRLEIDRRHERDSTGVPIVPDSGIFTGPFESVENVKRERPQE